jgi:hypothetical protein
MIDTVKVTEADRDWGTAESSFEDIHPVPFHFKKDSFKYLYLSVQLMRESGSGTVYARLHITDGVDDYYSSTNMSSTSASWEWPSNAPVNINISALADKEWDMYVQGKADSGVMRARCFVFRRVS